MTIFFALVLMGLLAVLIYYIFFPLAKLLVAATKAELRWLSQRRIRREPPVEGQYWISEKDLTVRSISKVTDFGLYYQVCPPGGGIKAYGVYSNFKDWIALTNEHRLLLLPGKGNG